MGRQADEEEEVGIMTRSNCECEGKAQPVMRAGREVMWGVKGGGNNSLQKAVIALGQWGCNPSHTFRGALLFLLHDDGREFLFSPSF